MGGEQLREAEGLWRLGAEQPGAGNGLDDCAGRGALQRVGDRLGRDGAGGFGERREQRRDGAARDHRPGGVVHQDHFGGMRREGFEPGADAGLAGLAAGDRGEGGQAGEDRGDAGLLPGGADRLQQGDPAFGQQRLRRMAQHRAAEEGEVLLGLVGPNRVPRPAAIRRAAMVIAG